MKLLLTGGMGFIGSHTAVVLLEAGYDVVLYDNLSNADRSVLDRIENIQHRRPDFIEGDIRDMATMEKALEGIDAVIHFAGLKAVGESVHKPVEYYDNNVNGTLVLLAAMHKKGVSRLIFSSSSTVYGTPERLPLTEDCPTGDATNPYGRSKLHIEQILADVCRAWPDFSAVCLRYFNPIGAHPSGLIGEDPNGIPNNLLPYVARVAHGTLPYLRVFGHDYPTPDGTGVRDFIHVMDLADGHAKAVPYVMNHTGWIAINLGCGRGYSVLEVVKAFEKADVVSKYNSVISEYWSKIATAFDVSAKKVDADWEQYLQNLSTLIQSCDQSSIREQSEELRSLLVFLGQCPQKLSPQLSI